MGRAAPEGIPLARLTRLDRFRDDDGRRMAELAKETVTRAVLELLREVVEGPPGTRDPWIVNDGPGCGVLGTLARLSAPADTAANPT